MKILLSLLLLISTFTKADVVKPALVEISIFSDKTIEVEIDLSLEAAMTGIGTQYKKTTDAPNSDQYDELRALEPAVLRELFKNFELKFLNSIQFSVNGKVQGLTLNRAKIDIVGYKKRPRKTILTYSVQLSEWPKILEWRYGEIYGDSALRYQVYKKDEYRQVKLKLFSFDSIQSVIINQDDAYHQDFLDASKGKKQTTYSIKDFEKITINEQGFLCQLDNFVFEIPLLGKFNLSNVLAAFNSVEQLGFSRESIIPLLSRLFPPLGRMQKIKNTLAWVDYAHTPDALANAITTLKEHYPEHKIRIVFGCGGNRDKSKRAKMGKIASKLADTIVLTNDNPRKEDPQAIINDILSGIDDSFELDITLDRQLAIETAITTLNEGECLLIAGKGHESTQEFKNKTTAFNDVEIAQNAAN